MKLFNLRISILEETDIKGLPVITTYELNDCILNPIKGRIVGFQFFVEIEDKTFFLTQTDEEDIIQFIPPDSTSPKDWITCLDNNCYDGCWNELDKYLSEDSINILTNIQLYLFLDNPLFSLK